MIPSKTIQSSHAVLISDIDSVLECVRDYSRAFPAFQMLSRDLMMFFEQQNAGFYAELDRLLTTERESAQMVRFLRQDILQLKVDFLEFSERYSAEVSSVRERNFPIDFQAFLKKVMDRISLEEEYLLPILANL